MRVILAGATGWAGSAIARGIARNRDLQLVAAVARTTAGQSLGAVLGDPALSAPVYATAAEALATPCDVFVEFTKPAGAKANILAALEAGAHVVVGTSGLGRRRLCRNRCRRAGAGARRARLRQLRADGRPAAAFRGDRGALPRSLRDHRLRARRQAGRAVRHGTRTRVSGSARSRRRTPACRSTQVRGPREARGATLNGVQVHSVRLPGYVIGVEAVFGAPGQRLHLAHHAGSSAEPYVDGALLAIRKVATLTGVHRGLDAVMPGDDAMSGADSTLRFSDRVEAYLAGRPRYPSELVTYLEATGALPAAGSCADIGVGTGLSADPFLAAGHRVIGVEPNAPMRAAGLEYLARYPHYEARDGTAEATGLESNSVDLVIAGQAFHWFEPGRFRTESLRVLRPGGWAALIWNDRGPHRHAVSRGLRSPTDRIRQRLPGHPLQASGHRRDTPVLRRARASRQGIPPPAKHGLGHGVGAGRLRLVSARAGPAAPCRAGGGAARVVQRECFKWHDRDALHVSRARGSARLRRDRDSTYHSPFPARSTMASAIEFYFDFSSPYSYIASEEIESFAERHGRELQLATDPAGRRVQGVGRHAAHRGLRPEGTLLGARLCALRRLRRRAVSASDRLSGRRSGSAARAVLWLQREQPHGGAVHPRGLPRAVRRGSQHQRRDGGDRAGQRHRHRRRETGRRCTGRLHQERPAHRGRAGDRARRVRRADVVHRWRDVLGS